MFWLKRFTVAFVIFLCSQAFGQELQEGRLLRFPDIHNDKIAFVYGGDIWLASSSGGTARRVTSHPGRELFPKFSPDGRWIAFTGQYDGNFNVYVMPAEGGQPRQLTFYQGAAQPLRERMGIHNEVVTWFPDGKRILFLSRRDASNGWVKRLYSVSIEGGLPEPLPLDQGGLASFSADGSKIAYNEIFRNFRTWKRYTGGLAQSISIYDIKNNTIDDLPHTEWTDTFPMWHENTIYFTSDRGSEHRQNLYSCDLNTKQVEQLTHFTDFDVMWPSLGPDAIIFENGGYLYTFNLQSKQSVKLSVMVPGDRSNAMKRRSEVTKYVTDFNISPDGKRAVISARGDVFTVPAKEGSIRNLTSTPGIREKGAAWSPDGRSIAYVSDRTGEEELYVTSQDGLGKEQQITSGYKGFKFGPVWSPDSKKLAWADKDVNLWYIDIHDRKPVQVDHGKYAGEIQNYSWSPDSKWLAYDKNDENQLSVVNLYSLADQKITPITTTMFNSYQPLFDPEGKFLYFLSDRDFNEVLGNIDFEFANPKTTRIYAVTLARDVPSPFPVQSDETKVASEAEAGGPDTLIESKQNPANKGKAPEAKEPKNVKEADKDKSKNPDHAMEKGREKTGDVRVDLDGIRDRIVGVPIDPAVIGTYAAGKGFLYYSKKPVQGLSGELPGEASEVHIYDVKERNDKVRIEGVEQFALSFDGTKLLYEGAKPEEGPHTYGIIDAQPSSADKSDGHPEAPKKVGDDALKLSGLRAEIDPSQEWKQMFNEVWRQERDYFFEPAMNGVDWPAIKQKYAQLLPYVADRYDLTYILGEMIGELSNSHTYVGGGDYPELHPVKVGLLGADFEADNNSGLYRFKKIYSGQNWDSKLRSPLTEPGVNVKEGDYLLAVNGRSLRVPQTPYEALTNTADEAVTLTVNSKPSQEGSHNVQVKPIADEFSLRELNMIETNRQKVAVATNGRVGYIYIPDMGPDGLNEFVKQYFPQLAKKGMIIDIRYNGGGFVDQLIFERLRRILAGMSSARNWDNTTVPANVLNGPMVCITNHYAASDGDIFSYYFKYYKLGTVIGDRTWGGVRGIRGNIPLMDGGYITRPEFARYDLNSQWIVENRGVEPDIEVKNRPDLVVKGQDPQLEKAIELVLKAIEANPKKLPPRPPDLPTYPPGPGM